MVNQNNINDIIKSKSSPSNYSALLATTSDIIQIINGVRELVQGTVKNFTSTVNDFKSLITMIYGDKETPGIIGLIQQTDARLAEMKKLRSKKLRKKLFNFIFDEMKMMIRKIKKLSKNAKKINYKGLDNLTNSIKAIGDIFNLFDKVKLGIGNELKINMINNTIENFIDLFKSIITDTWLLRLSSNKAMIALFENVNHIINIIERINSIPTKQIIMVKINVSIINGIFESLVELFKFKFKYILSSFNYVKRVFSNILEIFDILDKSSVGIKNWLKLEIISMCVETISDILSKTFRFVWKSIFIPLPLLLKTKIIFKLLTDIFNYVSSIKLFLTFAKFNKLYRSISRIRLILQRLSHIGRMKNMLGTILYLVGVRLIFKLLVNIMKDAALAGLMAIPFTITGPMLLLSIVIIATIVKIIGLIARGLSRVIVNLIILSIIMLLLTTIAMNMLTLSLVSILVMKNIFPLMMFLVSLVPILLVIIGIGAVVSLMSFVAIPAVIGVGALAIMVGVIVLIASMLVVLEKIKLNEKVIIANTKKVLNTVKYIITGLFDEDEAGDIGKSMNKSKGGLGLIKSIFKSSDLMSQSLASSALLIMSIISVTAILLICAELLLLEKIKLNENTIKTNISIVIGLCRYIINILFKGESTDDIGKNKEPEKVGWFKSIFESFGNTIKGIGNIIGSLISSTFLVSSFISIFAILLIAGSLTLITKLSINEGTIISNINKVLVVCNKLTDIIFNPESKTLNEGKEDEKKSGWLKNLFRGIGGVITLIMGSAFLLTSLLSISLIFFLGKEMNAIAKMTINEKDITNNIDVIFQTMDSIIGIITSPAQRDEANNEDKSFFEKLLNIVDPNGNLTLLASMGRIALYVATIGLVKMLADQLSSLNKLPELGNVTENINVMFNKVDDIVSLVSSKEIKKSHINNVNEKMSLMMSILDNIYDGDFKNTVVESRIALFDGVINAYKLLYDLKIVDEEPVKLMEKNISKVIKSLEKINDSKINIFNTENKLALFDKIISTYKELYNLDGFNNIDYEESTKFIGQIGTFVEKINTIDNTQIEKTRDIFKDMVKSVKDLNTNFEKLSKTMDKDIAKSLETMNKQLEKSGGLFNNGVQTTSQTSTTPQSTNQSDMDNTLKTQLNQQLINDNEALGYMEEIIRLLKSNKFKVIMT